MFAISTSWNAKRHTQAGELVNEIKSLGFKKIELSFKLTRPIVEDIIKLTNAGKIEVVSIHNICPVPDGIDVSAASPDYYNLASREGSQRKMAVDLAKTSVDYAKRLGAQCVVVHAGRVEIPEQFSRLSKLFNAGLFSSPEFSALRDEVLRMRQDNAPKYIDAVIQSLVEITKYAQDHGVKIGLENRYYIREIPNIGEFKLIFDAVRSKNLFYWHDTGHAQVFENLGIFKHIDLLEKYKDRLIGMHLHDVSGLLDHQSPPKGSLDFTKIKPYIKKDMPLVLEPHYPADKEDVIASCVYLKDLFFGT